MNRFAVHVFTENKLVIMVALVMFSRPVLQAFGRSIRQVVMNILIQDQSISLKNRLVRLGSYGDPLQGTNSSLEQVVKSFLQALQAILINGQMIHLM